MIKGKDKRMTDDTAPKTGIRGWLRTVKDHWPWVTPLIYVYVSIVGMVDAWKHFGVFGINVFEFAEINDFILAAFREPKTFLMILGLFAIVLISYGITYGILSGVSYTFPSIDSSRKSSKQIGKIMAFSLAVVYLALGAYWGPVLFNNRYDHDWKQNILCEKNRHVEVTFSNRGDVEPNPQKLVFLGTTDKYVFFYDNDNKSTVVPYANIFLMEQIFSTDSTQQIQRCPKIDVKS